MVNQRLGLVALIFFLSVSSAHPNDLQQIKHYESVVYEAIVKWGENSPDEDHLLENKIIASDLRDDKTQAANIFRHLLWEGFDGDSTVQQWIPSPSQPLVESDWQSLKNIDETLYASVRAYYIFATISKVDNTNLSVVEAIERLRSLKSEMLLTANLKAVAIVSAWLGNVLSEFSYIEAIAEYKYAFNHLAIDSQENSFEVMLTQRTVSAYLSNMFLELQAYSLALAYGEYILTHVPVEERTAVDYIPSVQALTHLHREEIALEYVNKLLELENVKQDKSQYIIALILKLSVYTNQTNASVIEEINELISQIKEAAAKSNIESFTSMIKAYLQLATTLRLALDDTEEAVLSGQIHKLKKQYRTWASTTSSSKEITLRLYQNLQKIYEVNGDYEKAYSFAKRYQSSKRDKEESILIDGSSLGNDALTKDIEIIKLQNLKSAQEKNRLTDKISFFRNLLFGLLAILLACTTFWYRRRHKHVKALADVDSLTGALTRRAMYKWVSYLPVGQSNCAVLIDIDFFKRINDQYGHSIGDEVLKLFSSTIKSEIRKVDKLCRYGGEEFLLILPNSDCENAREVIERIRSKLVDLSSWGENKFQFSIDFSAGGVNFINPEKIERILEKADHLLYVAKSSGRGRTIMEFD